MTDISPLMIGSPETGLYKRDLRPLSIFDRSLIVPAIWASFRKLDPRTLVKKPVMFCVEIVSVLTTIFFLRDRTPISAVRPRAARNQSAEV
jgi:high-affinity K+ transport system ATPase subunit B